MTDHIERAAAPAGAPAAEVVFSERLRVPLWWWPLAFAVAALLAVEVHLAYDAVPVAAAFAALAPVPAAVLLWWGRTRVAVTASPEGSFLRAGPAVLPLGVVARAAIVPAAAKRSAMGRQLDPAAYLQHRAWVRTMVLVVLDDPEDPTPYWLVSTRRPQALVAALGAGDATR